MKSKKFSIYESIGVHVNRHVDYDVKYNNHIIICSKIGSTLYTATKNDNVNNYVMNFSNDNRILLLHNVTWYFSCLTPK